MKLSVLNGVFAVCRLSSEEPVPAWIDRERFWTITRTDEELSVACAQESVPSAVKAERDWKVLKIHGPLDFGMTGVLAALANPLASARISIFAISTFDTDYVFVREPQLEAAKTALRESGFQFV